MKFTENRHSLWSEEFDALPALINNTCEARAETLMCCWRWVPIRTESDQAMHGPTEGSCIAETMQSFLIYARTGTMALADGDQPSIRELVKRLEDVLFCTLIGEPADSNERMIAHYRAMREQGSNAAPCLLVELLGAIHARMSIAEGKNVLRFDLASLAGVSANRVRCALYSADLKGAPRIAGQSRAVAHPITHKSAVAWLAKRNIPGYGALKPATSG